ncbi:MAG TPA: hypothetical protein P5262_02525 [Candidatus Moranbacteria bacterium]|nr:hypothetical protein [Candidatus Moranbacteria bacterium]
MEEKENKNSEKIQALREMIYNAEKTLQGAKAMLLQLEGKKKVGRKKKTEIAQGEEGKIIEGTFDGQIMIGSDGRQYPVPANYASKSKLVEGDMLKLTITPDGSFVYKQIGPVEKKRLIGTASQDADGNYFIASEGKAYKVLLASITYFKVEPGDEVTLVIPRDIESDWGAIENVLQKGRDHKISEDFSPAKDIDEIISGKKNPKNKKEDFQGASILDEWTPDLEKLKEELNNHKE